MCTSQQPRYCAIHNTETEREEERKELSVKALLRFFYGSMKALLRLYEGSN
jgi:hypothetical protein